MTDCFEQTVKSISESIRFDSSLKDPTPAMPFGKGAADCLAHFLSLAQDLGFETHNYDNYIGEVTFGTGPAEFAILAHLDVVPAGSGWTKDPFGGEVSDDKIWGRGAMDDKGPAFCVLYAMKQLKDDGFVPKKRIRFLLGCNEESGWGCIDHFNEVSTMPEEGFSPDGSFPVIYAEKGILHVRLHFPVKNPPFSYLSGGTSVNMVCAECSATPRTLTVTRARELGLEIKGDWQVFRFETVHRRTGKMAGRAINALGFVIHRDRVGIRKSILKRARRKAFKIGREKRYRRIDAAAMVSYMGYFSHSYTYGYYLRYIKPNVSIQRCKRRIAAANKKQKTC